MRKPYVLLFSCIIFLELVWIVPCILSFFVTKTSILYSFAGTWKTGFICAHSIIGLLVFAVVFAITMGNWIISSL